MFRIVCDPSKVVQYFHDLGRSDQLPYAGARFVNRLADRVQANVRDSIRQNFKLKREQWVLRSIKIRKADRATKTNWGVIISVEYMDLAKMEFGIAHTPSNGRALLAAQAGQLTDKIVRGSNKLNIKNLGLGTGTLTPGMKGTNGVFTQMSKNGNLIVLQRVAKGKGKGWDGVVKLYRATSRIKRPAKLHFLEIANRTVKADAQIAFQQAVGDVLRSMRPR